MSWGSLRGLGAMVCIAGLSITSACSATPVSTNAPSILDQGEYVDASEAQLAILAAYEDTGVLTFDQAHEAVLATFRCFDDAGVYYREQIETSYTGLLLPGYIFGTPPEMGVTEEEGLAIADACQRQNSDYVMQAYQLQTSSVQMEEDTLNRYLPDIKACLNERGVETTDDMTISEVMVAAAWDSTGGEDPSTYAGPPVRQDCVTLVISASYG